jgi:hypothetical protein
VFLLAALFPVLSPTPAHALAWAHAFRLTIDHTKIDSTLTNFPVMVQLDGTSGIGNVDATAIFDNLTSDANRKKIAVTLADMTTECKVEIASWNTTAEKARLWVKVPSVSNTVDTVLYLYYDSTQPDNTTNVGDTNSAPAEAVWDANYIAVYHLEESGNGTAGEYKDATANHHHAQGGDGNAINTPTKAAWGQYFDPVGGAANKKWITIPDADAFSITTTNDFTVSAWFESDDIDNPTTPGTYWQPFGKGGAGTFEWMFVFYPDTITVPAEMGRNQWISFYVNDPSGGLGAGDLSTGAYSAGQWQRIVGTAQATDATHGIEYVYRDDMVHTGWDPDTWQEYGITYANGTEPVRIGMEHYTGWSGAHYGDIAEVRFSNTTRSSAWESASFHSEGDALITYLAGVGPPAPTNVAATDGTSTANVTVTWTKSAMATNYRVYRDGADVSGLLGDVATYTDTTAAAPTVTPGASAATDGTNADNITLTISGQAANNGTTHTYKVRAANSDGYSGDSATNTGYRGVGSLTYQWWRSAADSAADYSSMAGATTATYVDTTAPAATLAGGTGAASDGTHTSNVNLSVTGTTASGAGRYYLCQLSATGAVSQITTADRGYRAVTGITYQWFATSTDANTGYAIIGGATTATWAYDAAPDPTITAGATVASDNLSTTYVTLTLSGSAAVPGAGRYFLCQSSAGGSSANSTFDRGYVGVGTLTVQWQRSAADSDAAYSNIAGGITNPYNDSGAPADGSGRYYKATLTATGAAGATTAVNRGNRLVAVTVPPTGNTMGDVVGWAMVLAAIAGIFTGAKNAPRYN